MTEQKFDVFLCHNSEDKPAVIQIAQQLRQNNLNPWLDVWEIRPGEVWQLVLERQIESIGAAAVFIGKQGIGPWQQQEIYCFLQEFVSRQLPVIPVMLADAPQQPKLPVLLKNIHWVDFRQPDPVPLAQLLWDITGVNPLAQLDTAQAIDTQITAAVGWAPPTNPPAAPEDDLSSEKGIDYSKLRDLLKAGQWRKADRETYETMIRAVGKEPDQRFTKEELLNFPCADLLTIDRLWVKYSKGKFGFSVQKKIWQECGPTTSGKNWDKFCVRVGWKDAKATQHLTYKELKANPDLSPAGEFPGLRWVGFFSGGWRWDCGVLSHRDL